MPAASTLRGKTHQAVAKFSGELVHFVRVTETIQIHFTVLFWGGCPLSHTLRTARKEYNRFQLLSILHIHFAAGSNLVHSGESTMTNPAHNQGI